MTIRDKQICDKLLSEIAIADELMTGLSQIEESASLCEGRFSSFQKKF